MNKKQETRYKQQIETIIVDDNSLPMARPSPNGLGGPPAPFDLSDFPELFDEWLPEPLPGQKRKLGHRRDDPPTPPLPRQPPSIIPRKTLPPRDSNALLVGGSVQSSPFFNNEKNNQERQYSFNVLLPLEKQNENENREQHERQTMSVNIDKESSMVISPIQNSTPEPMIKSPSVIPKNGIAVTTTHMSFEYSVIPIECRYHFKRMKQKCTFEVIRAHQNFLENKYKILENEREEKLQSLFSEQQRFRVISLVKNTVEKVLENKKKNDQRRLDNLQLDQMREKAAQTIERTATQLEQQQVERLHEKFMRTLDLKLQLDKLEKRFMENMPPPSLNIFDKLQLHAKELKPDDNRLNSLREQWRNVLRKTKLDLTALMRQAKIAELEQANSEYQEQMKNLSENLHEPYDTMCHVSRTRHNQFAKRKLNFLAKRACTTNEN